MSGRHPSSPSRNRDDGRRRNNSHPHHHNNRPTSSSGRYHDGPPRRQHHRHHSNNIEQQPPPYSRYTNHSAHERRESSSPSTSYVTSQQQQQHPSLPTNNRAISFAEKRRLQQQRELQERREFDNSFSSSAQSTAETAGIHINDATLLRRQHSGGSQTSTNPTDGGIQISNDYLKDILSTAVGNAATTTAATSTAGNTTMSTTDNEVTSATTSNTNNSNNNNGARDNRGRTSINLANYSSSGKRLGGSSQQQQRFVVENGSGEVNVFSGMAAAASSDSTAPAAAGNHTNSSSNAKPVSILKSSLKKTSSLKRSLKSSSNYSSQAGQQAPSNQQQQQPHSATATQSKVFFGDNSTMEIESRLSPVNVGGVAVAAGGNNNFIRRNSNESHPNNINGPPPNHPNNFNRRNSGGGGEHLHSPSSNSPNNNNFTRRNSGGNNGQRKQMGFNAPCQIEEHKGLHKWKDCPNNPHSDNFNGIHFKTAGHQQLLESVQAERQAQFQRRQQQQHQRRQTMSNLQEQEANRARGVGNPPAVVAASSLKRPVAAASASTSAVAAARRLPESSNLFNKTKSARTLTANGSIPKKQRTEMHSSSSTTMQIPRKKAPPPPQPQKVDLRNQKNVEYKNGRFQRKRSNNLAPSGQDAVPIAKQKSGRIVSKAKKVPPVMRGREDVSRGGVAHRGGNNESVAAAMDASSDESHHTLMDDEIIELDDFGTTDFGGDDDDGSDKKEKAASTAPSRGEKDKALPAPASPASSKTLKLTLVRDPEKNRKNSKSVNRKEEKKKSDEGDEKTKLKKKKGDEGDEMKIGKKKDGDVGEKVKVKKKKHVDIEKKKKAKDKKQVESSGEKKAEKKKDTVGNEKKAKRKIDDGGDDTKSKKKKVDGGDDKKAKKTQDGVCDDKKAKTIKDSGSDDKKANTMQDGDGNDEKGEKQKPDSIKPIEKKKKKSKKKCRKPGCDTTRLKGSRFCKAHVFTDALASEIDDKSSRSAKPTIKEGETDPQKKVKAKKRGRKRKSPPEPTPNVASLGNANDVLETGTSSSNKRQALEEIHRSSNNQYHSDQLTNHYNESLPELDDGEVEEMESDLFNLLDQTIKIRYQDYVEEHKIDEDLLLEEEQALLESRREDTSPPDENSLAKGVSSPNRDKENMPSALNSLTDNTSMDTGDDSDDDDQIPLFYTCEKCDRVFFARSQVVDHENQCTKTKAILDGRVFTNPNDIAEYYEKHHSGGEIKSDCVIFYRPPLPTPFDLSGRTISPEDFEGRSGNRNDLPHNLLDDFMSSKSPQATSENKKKNVETDFRIDSNNTRDSCMVMNAIEHLSSTVINLNGLPSQTITTFCGETETLYDFRVEIKPSKIPNSGLGAFVTFLGARVLKKDASNRWARLLGEHVTHDDNGDLFVKTHDELTAEMYGGRKMNVTLKGNNLHHNDNSLYWSKERQRYLKKHVEEHGTLLDHFDEDEICCKVNSEVKKYRSRIPEGERIGFLGIHSESDYVEDKTVVFCSEKVGLGMLELGRYGPHRRIDVKDNLHFCFKNFIFDFEPSEWSYGVGDQRLGRDQAIDITDDATGEVHSLARQSTPIYVNEVGHNKQLHCNVDIRHTDECAVKYYIFIDKDHAMKAGDEVELLVDYGEAYEDVRERKGYGKDNNEINGGDYDDDAARLKRNFVDREMAQLDIDDLKLFDMFYLVEYLTNDVLAPIDLRIRQGHGHGQAESFTRLSKDVVARQRMHWLKIHFQRRLKEMMTNPDPNDELLTLSVTKGGKEMVRSIEVSLLKWDFTMLPDIFTFLNTVRIGGGKTVQDVIFHELSEETLYFVASKLPDPLNRSVWCKISVDLTESITRDIARYFVYSKEPMLARVQMLGKQLLDNAKNAANKVREACCIINTGNSSLSRDAAIDKLSFHSLSRKMKKKDIAPGGSLISVYANELNIDYGTAATIADIQAYQDAVELGYLEPHFNPCSSRRLADTKLSMVSQYPSSNHQSGNQQFHRMARSIDAFKSGVARVNEQWYLLNQILLPAHTLVSECVKWKEFPEGFQSYSLEKICEAIGVELEDAKETIKRGVIRPNWPELEDKSTDSSTTKKKKRLRRALSNEARTLENCESKEFPGWIVERIQRKNSHHVDSYFSHPGLVGVVVRSRVGVREMISKMETNLIDAKAAYDILMSEGKQKYFGGRRS